MSGVTANTSHFALHLKQLNMSLAVDSFNWQQELATDDYLKIIVRSETVLSLEHLLKQPAYFSMQNEYGENCFHGVITQAQSIGITPDFKEYVYTLLLQSPLYCMQNAAQSRLFLNLSTIELLEQLLQQAGFSTLQYSFDVNVEYPKRDCLIQLNETDFDFFQRQLKHWGLFYSWKQDAEHFKLLITDYLVAFDKITTTKKLFYQPLSGTERAKASVFHYQVQHELLAGETRLRDYNPTQPELGLLLKSRSKHHTDTPKFGQDYYYGEHFLSDNEGELFLNVKQQMLDWQRETVSFFIDYTDIKLGQRLQVKDCATTELNRDYYVIAITHKGRQDEGKIYPLEKSHVIENCHSGLTYHNHVLCIPAGVPYRPIVSHQKIYHGYFTATVTKQPNMVNSSETNIESAHLDEGGSYYVKFDFDSNNLISPPLRLAQPYAGSEFGWHLPLTPGVTVLGAFENGDADRPILLGALPSDTTPSPVTANNPWQHIIRTAGNHTLLLDDSPTQEKIELTTPNRTHLLQLSAPQDAPTDESPKIQLRTEQGNMNWQALQEITAVSKSTTTHKIGQSHYVTVAKQVQTQTEEGNIELQANHTLQLKSKQNFDWQAAQGSVNLQSNEQIILNSNHGMELQSKYGDIFINSSSGSIKVNAANGITLTTQGKGNICFMQSAATFKIDSEGNLSAKAHTINIFSEQNNVVG